MAKSLGGEKFEKIAQFKKVAKQTPSQIKAKITATKLNLKSQNIYIKPLLKP
jgi:hypothetical protein